MKGEIVGISGRFAAARGAEDNRAFSAGAREDLSATPRVHPPPSFARAVVRALEGNPPVKMSDETDEQEIEMWKIRKVRLARCDPL